MGTAFLVLAHEHPDRVGRLVARLHPDRVFVHIDARRDQEPFRGIGLQAHATLIDPIPVCWAGFSQMKAIMRLIQAALAEPDVQRLVLLSGSCYPIRPLSEFRAMLEERDECHLTSVPLSWHTTPVKMAELQRRHHFDWDRFPPGRFARRAVKVVGSMLPPRHEPPLGIRPHSGCSWWVLTRAAAEFVVEQYTTNPALVGYYRRTLGPDEQFIQTIIANSIHDRPHHHVTSHDAARFEESGLHYIAPTMEFSKRRQGAQAVHLQPADFETLRTCGKFFARKIYDEQLLDLIDRDLLRLESTAVARMAE